MHRKYDIVQKVKSFHQSRFKLTSYHGNFNLVSKWPIHDVPWQNTSRFFTYLVNDFQCQQWIKIIVPHHQSTQTIGDQLLHFRNLPTDLFPQELKFLQLLSVKEFNHRINFRGHYLQSYSSSYLHMYSSQNPEKKLYNSVITPGYWTKI